jgi:threonine/homoserine/homoserine lactone efflux protein
MILYLLQGATLALPAAIIPGPLQAYLLSQALKTGWKRTLPAALAPLISDGPIIALVLLALTRTPQWFLDILRIGGGLFILYLARGLILSLKRSAGPSPGPPENAVRKTLLNAVVMNLLNPTPYIFWSVVLGPVLLTGWRQAPGLGVAFLIGFYGALLCCLGALIIAFGTAGRLHPRVNRILSTIAAAALVVYGLYQIAAGLRAFM